MKRQRQSKRKSAKRARAKKEPPHRFRAPAPITPVHTSGALWLDSREPKSSQIPPDAPLYFPRDYWPRTVVIIAEACKKFSNQRQTLELANEVTSQRTPIFVEAVKAGEMTPNAVLLKGQGGMADLLHSLLVYNCDSNSERSRLWSAATNSDEWVKLAGEIANATGKLTLPSNSGLHAHQAPDDKGNPALLEGKDAVTFKTAERYLGISERQRQNLMHDHALTVQGKGQNRRITTDSLKTYPPRKNPKRPETTRNKPQSVSLQFPTQASSVRFDELFLGDFEHTPSV